MAEDESSQQEVVPADPSASDADDVRPTDNVQQELFPFEQFMDVERKRIDALNRRTEVAREAIQMGNDADQRQYDFHMEQLHVKDQGEQRRNRLAQYILFGGGGVFTALLTLIFWMAFFGNVDQSAMAVQIISVLGIAAGGGGVFYLFWSAIRGLLQR